MKYFYTLLMVFFISTSLFSLDWGGNLEDSSIAYISDSTNIYHDDTLSLWLATDLWDNADVFVRGSYTYTTDKLWFFDLDRLELNIDESPSINVSLGRLAVSDLSGILFNQKLDGISLILNSYDSIISATAGYTGSLFKESSNVTMSIADKSDMSDDSVLFASPRIITGINMLFPESFKNQDIKISFWQEKDLRKSNLMSEGPSAPTGLGGNIDILYFGIGSSGKIIPSLFYDTFSYLGMGKTLSYISSSYTYKNILSYLGYAGLRYYIPEALNSQISFKFLYTSGDSDHNSSFLEGNTSGQSTLFIPISKTSVALIFSPSLGNIFFTQLGYSFKPFFKSQSSLLKKIQLELMDINFFRSTTGQISESGINPASNSLYLGTEIDGTVNFRPYSDLGVSFSTGIFIPSSGGVNAFQNSKDIELLLRLGLSFSF
ncbi:MAG: hypothetical protein DRP58_02675 [Spirochaetes bacterium]|nr:MAG: hypothetical protein DRP58_02675 [Spirochaetota bacterium]